jgi:hypothetical protein
MCREPHPKPIPLTDDDSVVWRQAFQDYKWQRKSKCHGSQQCGHFGVDTIVVPFYAIRERNSFGLTQVAIAFNEFLKKVALVRGDGCSNLLSQEGPYIVANYGAGLLQSFSNCK